MFEKTRFRDKDDICMISLMFWNPDQTQSCYNLQPQPNPHTQPAPTIHNQPTQLPMFDKTRFKDKADICVISLMFWNPDPSPSYSNLQPQPTPKPNPSQSYSNLQPQPTPT